MTGHDHEHEAMLRRVVLGELPPAAAQELSAGCARCRTALEAMHALAARLAECGDDVRRATREAMATTTDADRARARAFVTGRLRARRRGRLLLVMATLAAIALVAVALFVRNSRTDDRARVPVFLGPKIECLAPLGKAQSLHEFAWHSEPAPPGGGFRVEVWDGASDDGAPPILRSPLLQQMRWQPTAEQADALPAAIRWRVTRLDSVSARLGEGSARAAR